MKKGVRNSFLAIAGVVVGGTLLLARAWSLGKDQVTQNRPPASDPAPQDSRAGTIANPAGTGVQMSADAAAPAVTQNRALLSAFATPINFYGKVLDQKGEPV